MTKTASLPDELEESSGLTYTYLGLFSLSDNNDPEFYRIDTATGKILQTIIIEGLSFIDKESIESDGKYIYIGDFGNNHDNRRNLKIVKVNMRDITDEKELTVKGEVISFFYPEQKHFSGKNVNMLLIVKL